MKTTVSAASAFAATKTDKASRSAQMASSRQHSKLGFLELLLLGCLLLFCLSTEGGIEAARIVDQQDEDNNGNENSVVVVEAETNSPSAVEAEICDIHQNEQLHALMDRICELCHDMYSHQRPNMRADCRSDCFRSQNFKRCLRLFKPAGRGGGQQRRKLRFMADALDALMLV